MVAFLGEWELDLPSPNQMTIARNELKLPIDDLENKYLSERRWCINVILCYFIFNLILK